MFVLRSRPAQALKEKKRENVKDKCTCLWGSNMAKVQTKPLSTRRSENGRTSGKAESAAAMMTMRDEGVVSTALTDTLRRRQMYSR